MAFLGMFFHLLDFLVFVCTYVVGVPFHQHTLVHIALMCIHTLAYLKDFILVHFIFFIFSSDIET